MNQTTSTNIDDIAPSFEPAELILMLLAVSGGTFAAAVVLPTWLPGLTTSLLGDQPKAFWYLARASGFVAYIALWLSVALGLIISNKMARLWNGGPTAVDLHQFTTWLAVGLTIFHALILLGDHYIKSTPAQVLLPFGYVNYRPEWVGAGQVAFYLAVIVAASFYVRKQIGYRMWRTLHYASFLVFLLITVHGIFAGTDSANLMPVYFAFGLATYFLTLYRILQSIKSPTPAQHARSARPNVPPARPNTAQARPNPAPAPSGVPARGSNE